MNYLSKTKESGFTLIELMIAMTIGLIILAALSSTFLMQRKAYDVQEQIAEMVQTARAAMESWGKGINAFRHLIWRGGNSGTWSCN